MCKQTVFNEISSIPISITCLLIFTLDCIYVRTYVYVCATWLIACEEQTCARVSFAFPFGLESLTGPICYSIRKIWAVAIWSVWRFLLRKPRWIRMIVYYFGEERNRIYVNCIRGCFDLARLPYSPRCWFNEITMDDILQIFRPCSYCCKKPKSDIMRAQVHLRSIYVLTNRVGPKLGR